jgi:hypothetical protein
MTPLRIFVSSIQMKQVIPLEIAMNAGFRVNINRSQLS